MCWFFRQAYDEKHSGKLEGEVALRYVSDLLEIAGLKEQVWVRPAPQFSFSLLRII